MDEILKEVANVSSCKEVCTSNFNFIQERCIYVGISKVRLLGDGRDTQDLVYNKHTGELVGFVNLGDINSHLLKF